MLHVVCDCGALLSVPPGTPGRTVKCRACGRSREVPEAASLGLEGAAGPPPAQGGPQRRSAHVPAPIPAPLHAPTHPPGPAMPPITFGSDQRLDLRDLERHAARLQVLSGMAWFAGLLGAAGAFAFSSRTPAERAVLACVCLFASLLGWASLSAARAAAQAAIVLAERQREIVRALGRQVWEG